ncbi:MAG: hypothetical protein QE279_11430 [Rhodoferax sp.]|nr:hypothetical protein [Rhodoferax sp.]
MTVYREPKFTRADFRQHYFPDPPQPGTASGGHWLLEDSFGRDLLKVKLLTVDRKSKVPLWSDGREYDSKLNDMIDVLGLRGLAKPGNRDDALKSAWMLFRLLAIAAFSFFAGRQV